MVKDGEDWHGLQTTITSCANRDVAPLRPPNALTPKEATDEKIHR